MTDQFRQGDETGERRRERGAESTLSMVPRRALPVPAKTGRPWCTAGRAVVSRTTRPASASELRLGDDEVVVARSQIDAWRDAAHVLAYAVDDTDRDPPTRTRPRPNCANPSTGSELSPLAPPHQPQVPAVSSRSTEPGWYRGRGGVGARAGPFWPLLRSSALSNSPKMR